MSQPRSIIITGAGSGIGAAVARTFAASGDRTHLVDLSQDRLDTVAAGLEGATTHVVDVTDADAVGRLVDAVVSDPPSPSLRARLEKKPSEFEEGAAATRTGEFADGCFGCSARAGAAAAAGDAGAVEERSTASAGS